MKTSKRLQQDYRSKAEVEREATILKMIVYNLLEQANTEAIEFPLTYQGPDCLMHIKVENNRCFINKPPYVARPPVIESDVEN